MRVVRKSGVVRNRQNPLSGSEVRGLTTGHKRSTHVLEGFLFLFVEPTNKVIGKCIVDRNRQLFCFKDVIASEVSTIQYLQKF